jgi:hypothetical protein
MQFVGDLSSTIVPMMIFAVPIVAIIGGITAGIVKTMTESRVIENAQRERLAAIQAGIDPAKLPPLPTPGGLTEMSEAAMNPELAMRRRVNGLMIGGLVTLFAGMGLGLFLYIADASGVSWAVGLVPAFIGVALLLSAYLVRPRGGI